MSEVDVRNFLDFFSKESKLIGDRAYFGGLCPRKLKAIRDCVLKECDRMEYTGSLMYDECPDRLMLRLKCKKIYDEVLRQNAGVCPCSDEEFLKDTITIMFLNEIYLRRVFR